MDTTEGIADFTMDETDSALSPLSVFSLLFKGMELPFSAPFKRVSAWDAELSAAVSLEMPLPARTFTPTIAPPATVPKTSALARSPATCPFLLLPSLTGSLLSSLLSSLSSISSMLYLLYIGSRFRYPLPGKL